MKNKGILYAVLAYLMWGVLPIYWKALKAVPAPEIIVHRILWACVIMLGVLIFGKKLAGFKAALNSPKRVLFFVLTAGLLGINWLVYIWAVNAGHLVQTSLGYFINPLVSVLLGVIFLKEKLRPMQWLPVGLAAAGVIYLTILYGQLPWISLALAFSFGLYGLLKKIAPLDPTYSMSLEMMILAVPSLGYLIYLESQGVSAFGHAGLLTTLLLLGAGLVTIMPIFLFSSAAQMIPLSMVGILQYLSTICQFLIGVLLYHEPFSSLQFIGFSIIWAALILYWGEAIQQRRSKPAEIQGAA